MIASVGECSELIPALSSFSTCCQTGIRVGISSYFDLDSLIFGPILLSVSILAQISFLKNLATVSHVGLRLNRGCVLVAHVPELLFLAKHALLVLSNFGLIVSYDVQVDF